jgi:PAS domain S-box-containing protein
MKPKHREQSYHLAGIGHWELELQNDDLYWNEELYWSDEIKTLHEVPLDYQPTLEDAIEFYEKGESRLKIQAAVENAIENGESYVIESKIVTAEGKHRWVRSLGEPVFEKGQCIRLFGSTQDVTDLKRKEERIKAQQKELQMFMENSLDGIMITSPDGSILKANKAACEMLGMRESEIIALGRDGLVFNDHKLQEALKRREETGNFSGELTFLHKSGEKIPVELTTSVYTTPQGESRTSMVIRDITNRKIQEQKLQDSLSEKETLLMEIHHRVKNNLAVVSGLMQLQAFSSSDEVLREKLNDSVNRIKTMASIHELLYKSNSFSRLDTDDIIQKLISEIIHGFGSETTLSTKFKLQSIELNINQAIPLSLIINEVVTNILKHAFTGRDQGMLAVFISESNQKIQLRITDNGKGLPKGFPNDVKTDSLGLQLIDTLSSQLEADYEYETEKGETHFRLTFQKTEVMGIGSAYVR